MKINSDKIVLIFACVVILILLYFYYAPLYMLLYANGLDFFRPRILTLKSAINYYGILSSLITLLGLFLGFSYYVHKLRVDNKTAKLERKRKRLEYLISELNNYNELIDDIIHSRFADAKELEKLRSKISRSFEIVEAMLVYKNELFGFDEDNTRTILQVNSFVEKNELLMQRDFKLLTKDSLLSLKEEFIDLIQDARQTCFEKIC